MSYRTTQESLQEFRFWSFTNANDRAPNQGDEPKTIALQFYVPPDGSYLELLESLHPSGIWCSFDDMSTGLCCSDVLIEGYADRLKVCGHPLRLKILCLIEREDSCVTDLWQCLNQSQPVISQHLAVLKEKGIVHAETRGNKRIYSITDPFIRRIVHSFYRDEDDKLPGAGRRLGGE